MTFPTRLLLAGAILLFTVAPARGQSGFAVTWPTSGAVVPAGQPITVVWTGGDPAATVNLILIDQEAWAFAQGFGLGPNSGSRTVTIDASDGPTGTCGRAFRFYIEDYPLTTWTYGGVFTVVCGAIPTVDEVLVGKSVSFVQTSDAPPVLDPANTYGAFSFFASVEGSNLAGLTPPTVSVPPGSGILNPGWASFYNGGVLGYNPDSDEWNFGSPYFNNFAAPTAALLDSVFSNGLYTFSVQGASVPLNLSPPNALGLPPTFTLTGGSWIGGKYVVNVRDTVTITSNPFSGYGANLDGLIYFGVGGEPGPVGQVLTRYSENPHADRISLTIKPCELAGGYDYQAYGAFVAIVDYKTGVPGIPSSQNGAFHQLETEFVISAVGSCADTTPPQIQTLTTSAPTLWPPNHRMVPITVTAVATDDVSAVTTRIVSAASSEPDYGLGDGDLAGDIEVTGPMTLQLRAERAEGGTGRVYTIVVEAKDESGNASTKEVHVVVPHHRGA